MHNKYTGLQIAFHWLTFILVVIAWFSMDFRDSFPRSMRPFILTLHASCGISVGIRLLARIFCVSETPFPLSDPHLPRGR